MRRWRRDRGVSGVEASKIGSDQAPCPEGLDVVRAYAALCCALASRRHLLLLLGPARRARRFARDRRQIEHDVGPLRVAVESSAAPMGCRTCGVIARWNGAES